MKNLGLVAIGLKWSPRPKQPIRLLALGRFFSTSSGDRLDFQTIDAKWQSKWGQRQPGPQAANGATSSQPKTYILPMFPYPSGTLHLGHLRVYTISDVIARYKHMQGHAVLHPMGWDAFGLPAENAAIEHGVDPSEWTLQNITKMKEQLSLMGGRWDWGTEFMTCDPDFYKHTQRIFLLLHENGLAYQAESLVNYDPVDKTVLANEQVDANGCSWRSGAKVEKIMLKQWFLRIKAFQEALLEDISLLSKDNRWPERVLTMQKNWLGKSNGANVRFQVKYDEASDNHLEVFTTRLDTLFGVQYIAVSLNHPIARKMAETDPSLKSFIENARNLPDDSKEGFRLSGVHAINPASRFNGPLQDDISKPLPIFVAPYVLDEYGSGAVMGVPGHDSRDFAFWTTNAGNEPVRQVICPSSAGLLAAPYLAREEEPFTGRGVLNFASGPFGGLKTEAAIVEIAKLLNEHEDGTANITAKWRLRDWLVSRQRYWGTPIPIIHCNSCGPVPVPQSDLPVALPKLLKHQLKGNGGNPLKDIEEWVNVPCPKCEKPAKRETDTMDTFMDSSWYFFRFADHRNQNAPIDPKIADERMPVDIYIGGVEHAILHLLYARFISKFLATTPLWPSGGGPENKGEPFKRVITQGMVHGKTYSDPATGRFLHPSEVDLTDSNNPIWKANGKTPKISFEKMSKSKYNGVDPGTCISQYGADAVRAHMLFAAPVTEVLEWHEERIVGIQRWFQRVWRIVTSEANQSPGHTLPGYVEESALNDEEADLWLLIQSTILSVSTSFEKSFALNTAVSDLIKLTNALASFKAAELRSKISKEVRYSGASALVQMMAPMTPAFAEECWEKLHRSQNSDTEVPSVFLSPFPTASQTTINSLASRKQQCAVQVNGKLRFATTIPVPTAGLLEKGKHEELRTWVVEKLLSTEEGEKHFGQGGKLDIRNDVKKIVVVQGGRTVNFVVPR